jgi:glucosamine 6-phosphate synthetase-like amidotransferase/phosphosugar isomerase protein
LALIDADNPNTTAVILIILDDEFLHLVKTSLSEVKARGAKTIVITDCFDKLDKAKVDHVIEINSDCGMLTPLLTVVPF